MSHMPQVPKEPLNDKTLRRVQQMHRWIRPPLRVAEHVRRREELSSVSGVTGERLDADLGAVFGGRLVISRDLGEVEKGGEKFEKFERKFERSLKSLESLKSLNRFKLFKVRFKLFKIQMARLTPILEAE